MLILSLLIAVLVVDFVLFSFEQYVWSVVCTVLTIVGAYYFYNFTHVWISSIGWGKLLGVYFPIYIGIGLLVALGKWFLYAFKIVTKIKSAREKFDSFSIPNKFQFSPFRHNREFEHFVTGKFNDEDLLTAKEQLQKIFRESFVGFFCHEHSCTPGKVSSWGNENSIVEALTPRAKNNIGKISVWIFQWPFTVLSTLFNDFVINLAKHFASLIDSIFSKPIEKLIKKVTAGVERI
jgi:hypothetical protein